MRTALIGLVLIVGAACQGTGSPPEAGTMDPVPVPAEVIVLGDFGSGTEEQYQVAETMRETVAGIDVELFLTVGDNFYNENVDRIWEEPYGWVSEDGIEIAAAWGNHDVDTETRASLVRSTLDPPGNYYTAELGEGKLLVLDSNNAQDSAQRDWFERELQDSGAPLIVAFHHPAYSCGAHGNDDAVQEAWGDLLDEHDVDLVLNGHDHSYQRFRADETTYVVVGGGGRFLTDIGSCPSGNPQLLVGNDTAHHFMMLEITDATISAEVIAANGSRIDSFEIDY